MRRTLVGAVAAIAVLGTASCGGSDPSDDRTALVYATIIRSLVPPVDATTDATVDTDVFVWGGPDRSIPIEVQVGTIQELDDYTSIRFVDDRDEAVDTDDPQEPVRNDGVLVTVDDVPERGNSITIGVSLETAAQSASFDVALEAGDAGWEIVEAP